MKEKKCNRTYKRKMSYMLFIQKKSSNLGIHLHLYRCVYTYVCVCVYVWIYVYIYIRLPK